MNNFYEDPDGFWDDERTEQDTAVQEWEEELKFLRTEAHESFDTETLHPSPPPPPGPPLGPPPQPPPEPLVPPPHPSPPPQPPLISP